MPTSSVGRASRTGLPACQRNSGAFRRTGKDACPTFHNRGVTLIELLVVVTIIGIFAAVAGTSLLQKPTEARIVAARQQLETFTAALGAFHLDVGRFPKTEEGLQALWEQPNGAAGWAGPYVHKEIPNDPWGNAYQYKPAGVRGLPEIVSYGADGRPGGEGHDADIVSWKK